MIVGVLGGIGAGKSTVARMLVELGAQAVNADALAHEVLESKPVREGLRQWLGAEVFQADGRVDRSAVSRRVFARQEDLRKLESLIHPPVVRMIKEKVKAFRAMGNDAAFLVLDVPLLAESPLLADCDSVLYVEAGPDIRRGRIAGRGWPADELERREEFQTNSEVKRRLADHIIDNSGSLEETRRQVAAFHAKLVRGGRSSGRGSL